MRSAGRQCDQTELRLTIARDARLTGDARLHLLVVLRIVVLVRWYANDDVIDNRLLRTGRQSREGLRAVEMIVCQGFARTATLAATLTTRGSASQ